MARRRYSDEFKIEAVKQVLENGYTITDTAERLGVHPTSLSSKKRPLHVVFAKNDEDNEIIIITAYYPDKDKWSEDYTTRIEK